MITDRNHWAGRLALVTGAEGFIGSTLVDELVRAGCRVRAFTHYKPYAEKGFLAGYADHPNVELLTGTCGTPSACTQPSRVSIPSSTWLR